ncbi:prepilin-type N-terminal cleavage/methylation domain-containing protein [Pigmentiphaga aceris]|uniref:prepilin-type N-terminal cleavage/methylation domain-containing protein n=1 Tax=Pigmentiphaga aceris TaxID=1940612 RepID=UPI001CA34A7F|nr:prepilin-type N-terminal cleavage/methylation domain-containing protein [Pigmentiphaga aceris]
MRQHVGSNVFASVRQPAGHDARGFTLIELLVVLVIVGIAATAVTIQSGPGPQQVLHQDASRLMQRFLAAQNEVRADGRPITWVYDDTGYRFARRAPIPLTNSPVTQAAAAALPPDTFEGDELLKGRTWAQAPVQVDVTPRGAPVFTAEWIAAPLTVRLVAGNASVLVVRDAAGRYSVQ